MQGETLKFVV